MNDALVIAVVVLWVLVLVLLAAVFALSRQIGILYERVAPMGALMLDSGPKVGEAAPVFEVDALSGGRIVIGRSAPLSTLLFFLSPTCPVCKKLLPILRSTARSEKEWLRIVLASDGERPAHEVFYRNQRLDPFPYILSKEVGLGFQVGKLPYAVLLDETGRVRAKGLVNSREQLESLFTAKELGVASAQEFVQSVQKA